MPKMKNTVTFLETEAERVLDRFRRHYRRVADFEDSRIGRLHCWVKDAFSLRSKSTSIQSKGRVQIDGDRIELG